MPQLGALGVNLRWNDTMRGQNMVLRGGKLSLSRPIWNRFVDFEIGYDETGGAVLFGQKRKDRIVTGFVALPLFDKLRVRALVGRRNSNIDAYSENFGLLNFEMLSR